MDVVTQGLRSYDDAVALRSATHDSVERCSVDSEALDLCIERWPETRQERVEREGAALTGTHRWAGPRSAPR